MFEQLIAAYDADRVTTLSWKSPHGRQCEITFVHQLPLNESNPDLLLNFLQYAEYDADGEPQKLFSWVTDLTITRNNALHLTRGGRARWKIENETFNTLKNQGYQFEHNFGHGEQNLSVVFALLMMLAFLVDQTQQLCCPLFRAVWQKFGSKRAAMGQPAFSLPALRLHVHAAFVCSHAERLGQRAAGSPAGYLLTRFFPHALTTPRLPNRSRCAHIARRHRKTLHSALVTSS